MKKSINFAEWSHNASQHLVRECFKVLVKQGDRGDLIRYVAREFMYNFVGALAQKTLEEELDQSEATDQERLDFVLENFAILKTQIQEAVGAALGDAMTDFAGQEIEYYCLIKPLEDPINKRPI